MEKLDITGYHDEPVPNTFFRQQHDTDHIAIILPGMGYTSHMPVLYYPASLLLFIGADVMRIEYDYSNRPDFLQLTGAERVNWLISDVSASCKAGLSQRCYQKITLIGKSIGTIAMGRLLTNDTMFNKARAIWLTPVFRNEELRKQVQQCRQKSLFVIGTADPNYDPVFLEEITARGEILVIDGADHSLEIEGDPLQSLKAMEKLIEAIKRFLS
jgi:hypothetical protein